MRIEVKRTCVKVLQYFVHAQYPPEVAISRDIAPAMYVCARVQYPPEVAISRYITPATYVCYTCMYAMARIRRTPFWAFLKPTRLRANRLQIPKGSSRLPGCLMNTQSTSQPQL